MLATGNTKYKSNSTVNQYNDPKHNSSEQFQGYIKKDNCLMLIGY